MNRPFAVVCAKFSRTPGDLYEEFSPRDKRGVALMSWKRQVRAGPYWVKPSFKEMRRLAGTDAGGCLPIRQPPLPPGNTILCIFRDGNVPG